MVHTFMGIIAISYKNRTHYIDVKHHKKV